MTKHFERVAISRQGREPEKSLPHPRKPFVTDQKYQISPARCPTWNGARCPYARCIITHECCAHPNHRLTRTRVLNRCCPRGGYYILLCSFLSFFFPVFRFFFFFLSFPPSNALLCFWSKYNVLCTRRETRWMDIIVQRRALVCTAAAAAAVYVLSFFRTPTDRFNWIKMRTEVLYWVAWASGSQTTMRPRALGVHYNTHVPMYICIFFLVRVCIYIFRSPPPPPHLSSTFSARSLLLEIRLTTIEEIPAVIRHRCLLHSLPNRFNVFFFLRPHIITLFCARPFDRTLRAPNCHAACTRHVRTYTIIHNTPR